MADRVQLAQLVLWSLTLGAVLSIPVGIGASQTIGWSAAVTIPLAFVVVAAVVFGVAATLISNAGQAAGTILSPSGRSTPYQEDYSQAAALTIRGEFAEAESVYREHIHEHPDRPEPYLRLARMLRDQVGRYDDAARWFRAARREATVTEAQEILIAHELIELFRGKLDDPVRAAPEYARLIERFPGSPEADWARAELAEVRKDMSNA